MREINRWTDTAPSLTFLLSAQNSIGDLQGKSWRVRIPFAGQPWDGRPGTQALFAPGGFTANLSPPAGVHVGGVQGIMSGASGDFEPRAQVIDAVEVLLTFDADAATFSDAPLVLSGRAPADEAKALAAGSYSYTTNNEVYVSNLARTFVACFEEEAVLTTLPNYFAAPVQTISDLRDVGENDRTDKQVRFVESVGTYGAQYAFDAQGTGTDDGNLVIAPSIGNGRWFKISAGGALLISNNLSDLDDTATARTNLGIGDVDNTSDADKPVSTATQNALDLKAPLASPALTGVPTAPTAAANTNSTQLATTAFVMATVGPARVFNETPVGTVNGINSIYTTTGNFVARSTAVYLNGVRQLLGTDYYETDDNEITFVMAPDANATLIIDYSTAA